MFQHIAKFALSITTKASKSLDDRPSQTTHLTKVPSPASRTMVSNRKFKGWYFTKATKEYCY